MTQNTKKILPYAVSVYIGAAFMNMCTNLTGSVLSDIMTYYHMNLDRGGMMSFFQFLGGIAVFPLFMGVIGDAAGLKIMMMTPALMTALSGVLGIMLPERSSG